MATLHGYTIHMAGRRWCVVELSDCWALMDRLDAVPQAESRFPKNDAGWRDALAQLQRADSMSPRNRHPAMVAGAPRVVQGRRPFSLSRFGILFSSAILGLSTFLPWAVLHYSAFDSSSPSELRGDLFDVMYHGWRIDAAWALLGLAALGAAQALVLPYLRVTLLSAIIGALALAPVVIGITQIHTFTRSGLSHPMVSIGYGMYVALGGCLLMMVTWAVFPNKTKRHSSPQVMAGARTDHLWTASTSGGAAGLENQSEIVRHGVGVGFALKGPPPVQTVQTVQTRTSLPPALESGFPDPPQPPVGADALPSLASALAELALHDSHDSEPCSVSVTEVAPAAGWYVDYVDVGLLRFWDGASWTGHVRPST